MTAAAIPWTVVLGLTATVTGFCLLLFLYVYWQLWLLLHYKQKKVSYQSFLLFLCLFWAGCRAVLFSFYLNNCLQDNELHPFPVWLLYYAPVCLQFCTLCLLHLYFCQVTLKACCTLEFSRYKIPLQFFCVMVSLLFLVVNLACILISNSTGGQRRWIPMTRITVSNCLFAVASISLARNTYKIANMTPAHVYLESKGTSGNQAVMTGSLISTLYILRAMYNLVVVFSQSDSKPTPFSYGWNGLSDHTFSEKNNDMEYMIFTLIFIFCEFLPMCLMTYFFNAKKLSQNLEAAGMVNSHSFGSRAYFFDNPRRYDSDDDLPRLAGARGERGSLSSTPRSGWYGTICPTSGCALAPPLSEPLSGAPVLFTCGANTLA